MNNFIFKSMGTLGVPIDSFNRKFGVDPITAAIFGGANLGNNMFNMFNQKRANETNLQMTRETNAANMAIADKTNETNERLLDKSNAFNLDMFNRTNEYNSPNAVKQRLLAAGVNPAAVLGSTQGAPASSISSANAQPAKGATMIPGHVEPIRSELDLNGMGQLALNAQSANVDASYKAAQTKLLNEQVLEQQFNNEHRTEQFYGNLIEQWSRIRNMDAKTETEKAAKEKALEDLKYLIDTHSERVRGVEAQNKNVDANTNKVNRETQAIGENQEIAREQNRINQAMVNVQSYLASIKDKEVQANIGQIEATTRKIAEEAKFLEDTHQFRVNQESESDWQSRIQTSILNLQKDGLSKQQQMQAVYYAFDVEKMQDKQKSIFAKAFRRWFGIELADFAPSASSGIGAAIIKGK